LWLVIFAFSCSTSNIIKVDYEYDQEVDFTALKSYGWFPIPKKNLKYELIVKQIKKEINTHLEDIGLERAYTNPDFLIAIHGGIQSWLDYSDWQYLHAHYEQYAQKRKTDFAEYFEDTLIVDFIDVKTSTLIYRATAISNISIEPTHEKRQKKINEAVTKILDTYTQFLNNKI
jgi:hypothetical protein